VNEAHIAVVGVSGAVGVVAKSEEFGELGHRRIRVVVIDRVEVRATGIDWRRRAGSFVGRAGVVVLTFGWDLSRLSHGRPQSHISNRYARAHAIDHTNQYRITMPRSGLVQQARAANSLHASRSTLG
jgi:hypothetical protein